MKRTLSILIAAAVCVLGPGCANDGDAAAGKPAPPQQETPAVSTLSGILRGGFAGIGGEHTGWVLMVPGREGESRQTEVEVDVSRVTAAARANEGKPVTAHGEFIEKRYVERGPTRVFVVERFQTCFGP